MFEAILLRKQKEVEAIKKSQSQETKEFTYSIENPETEFLLASMGKLKIIKK